MNIAFSLFRHLFNYKKFSHYSEWLPDWGGGIELWCPNHHKKLSHHYGSNGDAILFETSEISYHQVPPITLEAELPRRALALYYFSNNWPSNTPERKTTDYQLTPQQWTNLLVKIFKFRKETEVPIVEKIQIQSPDPWSYQREDIIIAREAFSAITNRFKGRRHEALLRLSYLSKIIEKTGFDDLAEDRCDWETSLLRGLSSTITKGDLCTESSFE